MRAHVIFLAVLLALLGPLPAAADDAPVPQPSPPSDRYELDWQATYIWQSHGPFSSPFAGTNSLAAVEDGQVSHTYTVYAGVRLSPRLDFYLDPEMARGRGVGNALGLAGYVNGDVIRNPFAGQDPYLAKYFFRWTLPTGKDEEKVEAAENQIPGTRPAHRIVVTAGKLGTNDIFDQNSYAANTRTQFMNWALINNPAYDYAADTRGYSIGMAVEWVHPEWAIRAGSFEMPVVANGIELSTDLSHNHGDQVELELHPHALAGSGPAVVRLMAYHNVAHMGDYLQALQAARVPGTPPDITQFEHVGATKYGYGLNFEQPLNQDGSTGLFGRLGWNDGHTESFAYTECDSDYTLGAQISGAGWSHPQDRLAIAYVHEDLSAPHAAYLAAGGLGFILGDGRLTYGPEQIVEAYYARPLDRTVTLSLDVQYVVNPGYDTSRGPVLVPGIRVHLER